MKKKHLILIAVLIIVLLVIGVLVFHPFSKANDALKFKKEYESLNGTRLESGQKVRSITIDRENPFIYKSAEEIVEMIDHQETFAVYFGFNTCPWCRSILPTFIEVAKDLKIESIYYVDVKEIRDTLTVDQEGKVQTTKKGSEGYYALLERLDAVLSDYSLQDASGKKVDAHEKRIYAPNVISILKGTPQKITTGISDKQENGYMQLTKEMLKDTYQKIECVLNCLQDDKKMCTQKGC